MVGEHETLLGVDSHGRGISLWDVSQLLPRHGQKRYRSRTEQDIRRIYVHHSGRLGMDGLEGLIRSARYMVNHRGWPGCSYHFWIPYRELVDDEGDRVVFRAQPNAARTYHAGGGPNERGLAIALQGNLTTHDMSEHQAQCLPILIRWLAKEIGITPKPLGHFQAPEDGHAKASCPGRAGKAWVLGFQAGLG